jgi:hypothetical protein
MAWHSQGWAHSAGTALHPLVSLDRTAPTRFAAVGLAKQQGELPLAL